MADINTPNFDFVKPEVGASEDTWGDKTNTNWDKADTAIFGRLAAAANLLDLVDKAASRLNLGFTGAAPGLAMLNSLGIATALPITDWNDAHTLGNGPLYANNAALNPPVAGTAFVGVYVGSAATFGAVLAMPLSGADMPIWVRRYSAGVWGAWGQLSLKTQTQPLDAMLTAIANLNTVADQIAFFSGPDTVVLTGFTAAGRALVDDVNATAQRTTLGLGTAAVAALVGTVSQSGGVPTGAVIERGSNANGEFTKWADGTMECWSKRSAVDATSPSGSIFQHTNLLSWTYPAAFIAAPMVTGAGGGTSRWCGISDPLLSSVPFRVLSSFSDATLLAPSLRAVGRWF